MKEKIKNIFNNFIIFSNRNFYPSSYEYFSREFTSAYSKICFDLNGIDFDSKSEIRLSYLNERFPLVEKFILLRKTNDSFERFKELAYVAFIEYLKVLKQNNTLYYFNSFHQKDTLFAQNVVNDHRTQFYTNLKKMLSLIEEEYSLSIKEKATNEKINKTNNKTGPKPFSIRIFTGLKYGLIHIHDKKTRSKDLADSNESFFKRIKKTLNIDIKAIYNEIIYEEKNLISFFKQKKRKKYIDSLLDDPEIKEYSEIIELLNKIKNSINSN